MRTANGALAARSIARRTLAIAALAPSMPGTAVEERNVSCWPTSHTSSRGAAIVAARSSMPATWADGCPSARHRATSAPRRCVPVRIGTPTSRPPPSAVPLTTTPASITRPPRLGAHPQPNVMSGSARRAFPVTRSILLSANSRPTRPCILISDGLSRVRPPADDSSRGPWPPRPSDSWGVVGGSSVSPYSCQGVRPRICKAGPRRTRLTWRFA